MADATESNSKNLFSSLSKLSSGLSDGLRGGLRVGQTTSVLAKTGIEWLRGDRPPPAKLMRQTFERLGATYIKLGQFVASSPSLFPPEYVREFQGCLDSVSALPYSSIKKIIAAEFDRPLEEIYASIDETPLASASIAQVHAAVLVTGEDVVIKVQKPGVQTVLITDFNFIYVAAKLLELFVPAMKRTSLSPIIGDIQRTMLEECDFLKEANNLELFRKFLADTNNSMACAPKVYPQATTSKVLTMERFYGVPLTDLDAIRSVTKTPELTLVTALNTWFASLMECQFFHADVHAGNLMVLNDGRIGFIDFGIVGHIAPEKWQALVGFMEAQMSEDWLRMAQCMVQIGATDEAVNPQVLAKDLRNLVEGTQELSPEQMMQPNLDDSDVNELMFSMIEIGKKHGIRFPREFGLLLKQFLYFDRYIQILAPEIDMFGDDRLNPLMLN